MAKDRSTPTWFKLESYAVLQEITNSQLCEEAFYRAYKLANFCDLSSLITRLSSGQICLFNSPRNQIFAAQNDVQISSSTSIQPVSIMDLDVLHQQIEKQFPTTIQDEMDKFTNGEPSLVILHASVAATMPKHVSRVLCNIDLSHPDEIIISNIKALLPDWREELGYPQPILKKRNSIIKSIIEQSSIPMLDLMIWARYNGFQYTDKQLADILYPCDQGDPDNPITEKHISDTHRPNALQLAGHDLRESIRRWCDQGHGATIVRDELM